MCYLAQMYEHGKGVEKNINLAKEYYQMASDLGFEYAIDKLKEFE